LFAEPLPPLGEALDGCGLPHEGELVALPGFDFRRWRANARYAMIANRYDLDDDEALAALAIITLYDQVAELFAAAVAAQEDGGAAVSEELVTEFLQLGQAAADPGHDGDIRGTVRALLPMLAEPAVAAAVLTETIGSGSEGAAALGLFGEMLEPLAPRDARPALRWLRGRANERLGDVTRAEADYEAAESLDPQWGLALVDLARYASDRGDADRGLALLRRAGAPADDTLVRLLERFQVGPRTDLGRNDPCWCGSGRKYKQCHLYREEVPLEERAEWLYQKAGTFLADDYRRAAMVTVAQARAQYSDGPYALLDALDAPLVADAVLFEGGGFAEFLATRGSLLPADERRLADQWLLVERSLYEIERVHLDRGCVVRDVRTGDVHEVRERKATRTLKEGELVCGRVVPAGDTMQFFGGLEPVAADQRDEVLALLDSKPDPVELVALLSRRFAAVSPPSEGSADLPDPAAVLDNFIRQYERKWLDEPLPALAGHTPREAAADPTHRGDLIRMLDTFPSDHGNPGVMSTDRLRAALDLR
jgi:tetratricopeptide (TPR) repeat protein